MKDDLYYISPESLEHRELTPHEIETILFSRKTNQEKPFDVAIAFILCILAAIIDPFKNKFINILLIVTFIVYIIIRAVLDHVPHIRYKSVASGKVLKKEIQYQDVGIKDTSIFKPYKINNTHINGTKQTKAFYYLIVKLSDDKYLRYVNCSKEDFHGLNTGDNVLVVYYGNNNLRGYKV